MSFRNILYIFIGFVLLGACKEKTVDSQIHIDKDLSIIQDVGFNALKGKRIYFGHASVGYNIINGIENIKATNNRFTEINIHELKDEDRIAAPGIYHSVNGKNGFPKTKIEGFKYLLKERGLGNKLDMAFFKFCYVDFNKDSNVNEIFDYYLKNIDEIKKEFPKLKIVHVTTPLYAHAWGLKGYIKNVMYGDISNVRRNEFNRLLIAKYKEIDPIYDLAKIESTLPGGARVSFKNKGKIYYSLAKQYTEDGGHLNELGRFLAAKGLLNVLCGL